MRILHLSDLHSPGVTLDEVWRGVRAAVGSARFDFVVVSGDLTQDAKKVDYEALCALAAGQFVRMLHHQDRARVIFVPGNHDVDWSRPVGDVVSFDDLGESVKSVIRDVRSQGGRGEYRQCLSDLGHSELRRIDPARYPQRFENVNRFFASFYGGVDARHRMMALDRPEADGADWSAHVFPEEKVAFFGFNSCHRNDRHWCGASFNVKAIRNAAEYADEVCARDFLRVAVWHHGLQSDARREDYLRMPDLAWLHGAGFRVGFHGHTHEQELKLVDAFFGERFAIAAVGSIGAGKNDRPDAVRNQFSIVELHPNQMHVDLFVKHAGGYASDGAVRTMYFLPERPPRPPLVSAKTHRRVYKVEDRGLAEATVELTDVRTDGTATILAAVTPPLSRVKGEGYADSTLGRLRVDREYLKATRRTRFEVRTANRYVPELSWKYLMSNGFALSRADLRGRTVEEHWVPNLPPGCDARPHTVRIRCDELVLRTELPPWVHVADVTALVERQEDGDENWTRIRSEESRCRVIAEANAIELTVERPIPGYRYASLYRLLDDGRFLDPTGEKVCGTLVDECRTKVRKPGALHVELASAITAALQDDNVLGRDAVNLTWLGLLWRPKREDDSHSGHLWSCFGRFPGLHWSTRFAWGNGVAGHAFRFCMPATWDRGRTDREDLIFLPPPRNAERKLDWIVCYPLVISNHGPAVGVISFEGVEGDQGAKGRAAAALKTLAARTDPSWQAELDARIWNNVNQAFWQTIASQDVGEFTRSYASRALAALDLEQPPVEGPGEKGA